MSKPRLMSLLALCAIAAPLGACGTETRTVSAPLPAPATPSATTAAPSVPVPEDAAPAAPEGTASGDDTRKEPLTVKGRRGDALTLLGQYLSSPTGRARTRVKVQVTLTAIRGPFAGFDLPAGRKLIGLDLRVTNVGAKRFDDALPGGTLTLVGGESARQTNLISGSAANPCPNPSLKLTRGRSRTVCVAFEVPQDARLQAFQYATDSGYGDTGLWKLR